MRKREERTRKRVGNDGHVQNGNSMSVLSYSWLFSSRSRTLYDVRTIGGENRENWCYPRNNGLSIAVSCQQTRVVKSQFTERTRTRFPRYSRHRFRNLRIYLHFSLLRHKVILVLDIWLSLIFLRNIRERTIDMLLIYELVFLQYGNRVLIKSNVKNRLDRNASSK